MKKTTTISNKVKNVLIKFVCATLVALTCFSMFTFSPAPTNNGASKLSLFVTAYAESVQENYVEKTLTATVLPEDAPDKSLDWTVGWNFNNEGENANVTDYVTVTPTADGSNVASVKCYKAFPGSSIVVTCTTRVGLFSARCIVTYVGTPSSLNIAQVGGTLVEDKDWGVTINNLPVGQTYNFDLELDNIFGNVTDDYVRDFEISCVAKGVLNLKAVNQNTTREIEHNLRCSGDPINKKFGVTYNNQDVLEDSDTYLKIRLNRDDNRLAIESIKHFSATSFYYLSSHYTFKNYVGGVPYLEITVTEKNSGVSKTINVRPEAVITDVSLDNGNLVF